MNYLKLYINLIRNAEKRDHENLSISHKGKVPANKGKSKILFEFKSIDDNLKIINGFKLRDYARLTKLLYKGFLVASTTTFKYKTFYIKRLGTAHA